MAQLPPYGFVEAWMVKLRPSNVFQMAVRVAERRQQRFAGFGLKKLGAADGVMMSGVSCQPPPKGFVLA